MDTQLLKGLLIKYLDMVEQIEEREDYFDINTSNFQELKSHGKYVPLYSDFDRVGKILRKETLEYERYFDKNKWR